MNGGPWAARVVAAWAATGCRAAGVALGDINLHFAWQTWHLVTSTFILRGKRGTWRHRPSLCVAGVALMALGWLWWRAWVSLVTHHLSHTTLSYPLFHTQLSHTHTHYLSHTTLSHTIFDTPLCHTTSVTHHLS